MSKTYALVDKSVPPRIVSIVPIEDLSLCEEYLSNFSEVIEVTDTSNLQVGWIKVDGAFVPGPAPLPVPQGILLASPNQTIWEVYVDDEGDLRTRRS